MFKYVLHSVYREEQFKILLVAFSGNDINNFLQNVEFFLLDK